MPACYRIAGDGLDIFCRVTPNAGADSVAGIVTRDDGSVRLALRVAAPPDKGRANKAAIALLAAALGCPKSAIVSGDTARQKTLHVAGDAGVLIGRLGNL